MSKTLNITLVGVGGQGTLLAGEILCRVALLSGKDVKKSEVHGMAQRGGSVVSQVRIGEKVHSPLIALGETDILIAFEKLEALRYAHFLSPAGVAMVNDQEIRPVTVSSGQAEWPENLDGMLKDTFANLEVIPALQIARELGNVRAVNLVMIGALSNHTDIDEAVWREAIEGSVKPRFVELNLKAFDSGKTHSR
ncbi:MAG: indolepyruvate oxidoreductase subunit beta [Armatimonadetes bacterium]|jgi:indolepyruvate ferredoxin oxidoreductase beta subunit|nr:indolepyruvate oxidoreductase subunit beta [Armatimonadota bacterium]